MAKKKPDYSTAGLSILGVKTEPEQENNNSDTFDNGHSTERPSFDNEEIETPKISETKKEIHDKKFISRTYYITPEQYKALKLRAATSDNPNEKDISGIVRSALDQYLANS